MDTNRTLVLTFANATGDKKSLTINKPASTLDAATVSAQMDALIASNIIVVENAAGTLEPVTQKVGAKFVTQTKTAVDVQ